MGNIKCQGDELYLDISNITSFLVNDLEFGAPVHHDHVVQIIKHKRGRTLELNSPMEVLVWDERGVVPADDVDAVQTRV